MINSSLNLTENRRILSDENITCGIAINVEMVIEQKYYRARRDVND